MALVEPSKPQTAYFIFLNDNRASLTEEAGKGQGAVAKLGAEKWKSLSEAAKKPYEAKAAAAKDAYAKALEEFKAAGGEPGKRRQEKKDAKDAKAAKKARKEERKNSDKPKRPASGFWLWQNENREALIKEAGTNKIPVIGKLAGERWTKLDQSQKAPFEKRAAALKADYEKALAEWKANNANAADDEDDDENDNDGAGEAKPEAAKPDAAKPAAKPEAAKPASPAKQGRGRPKAQPKAKGKVKEDDAASAAETVDPAVLKKAKDAGLESALMNLSQRAELKGKSADAMLKALQNSGGLVNKAKAALLAGA